MNLMILGQSLPSCLHSQHLCICSLPILYLKSSEGGGRIGSTDLPLIWANIKAEVSNRVVTECLQGSLLSTASPFTSIDVTAPPALGSHSFPAVTLTSVT